MGKIVEKYAINTLFIVSFLLTIYSYYNWHETTGLVYIFFVPISFVFLGFIINLKTKFIWVNFLWYLIASLLDEYTKLFTDMSREESYFTLWILIPLYYITILFSTKDKPQKYTKVLSNYDEILIAFFSKIAKADGQISENEAKYLSEKIDMFCKVTSTNRDIYKEIINNEKDKTDNIELLCKELLADTPLNIEDQLPMLVLFIELAHIDGDHNKKEEIILKIIRNLDINIQVYQNAKEEFENSHSFDDNNLDLNECYKILESKDTDTLSTIKQNYRQLIRQYHPDSNASKDLPQGMIDFAEKQTKILNESFERVKNIHNKI